MSASPKQRDLVTSLLMDLKADETTRLQVLGVLADPQASPARGGPISKLIDGLIDEKNRRSKAAATPAASTSATAPVHPGRGKVNELIRDLEVPCAMYAIPTAALPSHLAALAPNNDHLFVVVDEFKETRYVKQLHGSPGSFSRTALNPDGGPDMRMDVVRAIKAADPYTATALFSTLYSCCGKCGAELTDPTSRHLKLGPTCRKAFGL